ncbi:MAG: hypothetical protein M3Y57_15380 [Acidobacteriota bacterium]|nr:hypothetical protein [Acidobacteriota bacterium]
MNRNKRPVSVMVLALIYIAVGAIGFARHFPNLRGMKALQYDDLWIEITEFLAILCGVFMLRGRNWARWLAVAWMAFHVVLSAFDGFHGFAIHCLFCAAIAWLLFRPEAARYFRSRTITILKNKVSSAESETWPPSLE